MLVSWTLMVGCGGEITVADVVERHRGMHDVVTDSMNQERFFHDGTWHEHYGDGLMFGPSSDLAGWAWLGCDGLWMTMGITDSGCSNLTCK